MDLLPTRKSVEEYIRQLERAGAAGAANLPVFEDAGQSYAARIASSDWVPFVHQADYHYFVARILFLQHILEYSLFASHQCIENYLKGFLRLRDQPPTGHHRLSHLVGEARRVSLTADSFVRSNYLDTIASKFDPFYEMPRYPVQRTKPKDGYAVFYPADVFVLDYFVLRMREILHLPKPGWDILTDQGSFFLQQCQMNAKEIYDLFFLWNISFSPAGPAGTA